MFILTGRELREQQINAAKAFIVKLSQSTATIEQAEAQWTMMGIELLLQRKITLEELKHSIEINFCAALSLLLDNLSQACHSGCCPLVSSGDAENAPEHGEEEEEGKEEEKEDASKPLDVFDEKDPGSTPKKTKVN